MNDPEKRLGEMYTPLIQEAVDKFLRVFGGEDGGSGYASLMRLIQRLDKASLEGDPNAEGALACVKQFSRLIDVAAGVQEQGKKEKQKRHGGFNGVFNHLYGPPEDEAKEELCRLVDKMCDQYTEAFADNSSVRQKEEVNE